jgi:hypothetical protein
MRGAPNFKEWPDPVSGEWKLDLLRWLQKETHIDAMIETGTCEGITPWRLQDCFRKILTVELHAGLFESASKRLGEIPNVRQYFGSSRTMLAQMIKDAQSERILFWLDAHSSGPHTADDGDVLPFELETITKLCPCALIVIDDMMGLEQFLGQVSTVNLSGWHVEYRTGEILVYRPENYTIPAFEEAL